MAILELGVELSNIQIASKALDDFQKKLSSIGKTKIGGNGPESGSEWDKAKAATEAYRLELLKLREAEKQNRPNTGVYGELSRELNKTRAEAKNLAAQMYQLTQSGQQATPQFDKLEKEFNDLKNKATQLDSGLKTIDGSLGQFQRNVGNYNGKVANANGVTMEFNRIIQDAPFGMMGIGNNIQQLAANWQTYSQQAKAAALANGQTIGTMGLLKGVMSNFLTTGNLLTFGIAAITSGWTYYNMKVKKTKEETRDMNNEFTKQLGALNSIIALTEKSAKTERDKATAVSMYNKELGDTLGKVDTYKQLESKLISSGVNYVQYLTLKAKAESVYQLSLKKTADLMDGIMTMETKGRGKGALSWTAQQLEKLKGMKLSDFTGLNLLSGFTADATRLIGDNKGGLKTITMEDQMRLIGLPNEKQFKQAISKYNLAIRVGLESYRKEWQKLAKINASGADITQELNELADKMKLANPDLNLDKDKNKVIKERFDYIQKIKELLADKQQQLDIFGLKGQAKELQELKNKYFDFYNELDKLEKRANKDKKAPKGTIGAIQGARGTGQELESKERAEIIAKWNEIYGQLTNEGLEKAGLISENARQKEISNWSKYVDELKSKLLETGKTIEEVNSFTSDLLSKGSQQLKSKFAIEDLGEIDKASDKLQEILDKPFTAKNRASLQGQIDERIKIFKQSALQIADMMKALGIKVDEGQLNSYISNTSNDIQNKGVSDLAKRTAIEFSESIKSEFSNIFSTFFSNLKSNVDEFGVGISSILGGITQTFTSIFDNINSKNTQGFMDNLLKQNADGVVNIAENWKNIKNDANSFNQSIGAGLSMAGNLVSGLTKQTSVVGQGLGGALSGAASMASTGNPWLIGAGALIGGISGIFGAKKKRKEEERQRQQLEEQKKTNALLERMNALAYTSSIIGGKTANGIVTGVNRNEFGEITVRINGKDLIGVFNRQNSSSRR